MDERDVQSAARTRALVERKQATPQLFQSALAGVPSRDRDAWIDSVLGVDLLDDGPDLPKGCTPYLPSSVDALCRIIEQASVRETDVFVDVGSGIGRAMMVVHLLTGADAIGLEIQSSLVSAARARATALDLSRVSTIQGDAAELVGSLTLGTVFFLYCPFSGDRLVKVFTQLEAVARTRMIRVCCIDTSLPPCPWLELTPSCAPDVAIYRSLRAREY